MIQNEKEKALYEAAGRHYKAGFNCAESVFRAFCEELPLNVTPESLKVPAGFGGGMSFKEGPCGAALRLAGVLHPRGRRRRTTRRRPARRAFLRLGPLRPL